MDKYNKIVMDYNCDTSRFIAQRDEAMSIIKENIEQMPFEYEEARQRVIDKGNEAFEAEQKRLKS